MQPSEPHATYLEDHHLLPAPACVLCQGADRHPAIEQILRYFTYAHLPSRLQDISRPFAELAEVLANGAQNAETTTALRKLLEAKDCAVRASLDAGDHPSTDTRPLEP